MNDHGEGVREGRLQPNIYFVISKRIAYLVDEKNPTGERQRSVIEKCVSADTVAETAQSVSMDKRPNQARSVSVDTPAKPNQGACLQTRLPRLSQVRVCRHAHRDEQCRITTG